MPDSRVSSREELIFILNQAAELEHSLICSYLFTAMSLKKEPDENLPESAIPLVQDWKQALNGIAIDEMMHLAIVNNMLVSLGGAPHFDRPNFPHGCPYYMPNLIIDLHPFNQETMRHFIAIEQPTGSDIPFPRPAGPESAVAGRLVNRIGADPHVLDSQGDLYGLIAAGLRYLCLRAGEADVFIGPPLKPALRDFLASSGWQPVTDQRSALRAVAQIVEQGEGASGDNPDSHYWKFRRILDVYLNMKAQNDAFEPAYPVLANPFARTPPEAQGPVNLIEGDLAIHTSDLFNEVYGALLQVLGRFFALNEETDEEGQTLCDVSMMLMTEALLPLGNFLVKLPAGPMHPGHNAGPSFVVRTMHALPYKDSAWRLLRERLAELSEHADDLSKEPGAASLGPVHEALERMSLRLASTPAAG